ncbi:MAG: AMP-binding protein, partial [Betaproteobacteria bacterium]
AGFRGPGVLRNFWKIVERHGINYLSGGPAVYSSLLDAPIGDADITSLRFGVSGAAPLSPELTRRFEAATGIRLLEGWGLTEAACASTVNPLHGERRVGSIGRALPGIEVKAVELDAGGRHVRDCADDAVGELVIRGATVFPGYLDEAGNAGLFLDGGWLKTGDLGRRDAQGYFWLAGRAKDLKVPQGHVSPGCGSPGEPGPLFGR